MQANIHETLPPLLALFAILLTPSMSAAASNPHVPGELLIGVRPEAASPARVARIAARVGRVEQRIPRLNVWRLCLRPGLSVPQAIARLRGNRDLRFAEPNYIGRLCATPNDTYFPRQHSLRKTQVDQAWDIWKPKQQVIIAVVDTGIDDKHPDLTSVMLRDAAGAVIGYNAIDRTANALDEHYHGTYGAGIAAAQVNNGRGIAGVAGWNPAVPGSESFVKLMPIKVSRSEGGGGRSAAIIADGIVWAADHGARVLSMSVSLASATVDGALQYAWERGCVMTQPAGNEATSITVSRTVREKVILVGATDAEDRLSDYSNYGPSVRVATYPDTLSTYMGSHMAGPRFATSWCAPQVAGEAALIMAQNPALSNQEVTQIIQSHVEPCAPFYGPLAPGGGRINVYRALQAAGTGAPVLTSVTVSPTRVKGGEAVQGMVFLGGPAPAGGVVVSLANSHRDLAAMPASVTVPEGAATAGFTVATSTADKVVPLRITASAAGLEKSAALSVQPVALSAITMQTADIFGGTAIIGKVTLNGPAPDGGAVVRVTSGGAALTAPAEVSVPAGKTSVTFRINSQPVGTDTAIGISAVYGGVTDTIPVRLYAPIPTALALTPASSAGGKVIQGRVTLTAAAPEGGLVVELTSSGDAAAVPTSILVPSGAKIATFDITTQPVTAETRVGIGASRNGETITKLLVLTP